MKMIGMVALMKKVKEVNGVKYTSKNKGIKYRQILFSVQSNL